MYNTFNLLQDVKKAFEAQRQLKCQDHGEMWKLTNGDFFHDTLVFAFYSSIWMFGDETYTLDFTGYFHGISEIEMDPGITEVRYLIENLVKYACEQYEATNSFTDASKFTELKDWENYEPVREFFVFTERVYHWINTQEDAKERLLDVVDNLAKAVFEGADPETLTFKDDGAKFQFQDCLRHTTEYFKEKVDSFYEILDACHR